MTGSPVAGAHGVVDLGPCAAGNEDWTAGHLMTDVDHQITFRTGALDDAGGIGGGGLDPMQGEIS